MGANSPRCFRCLKLPAELAEYREIAEEFGSDCHPDAAVRRLEGTYNSETNTFCCTSCYIAIGQPSAADGWVAPAVGADWRNAT
jgi:hypothetical protein